MATLTPSRRRSLRILSSAIGAALLFAANAVRASEIAFEPNLGQTDPQARFLARGRGYVLFLTPREAVLALPQAGPPLRMRLAGAQEAKLAGEGLLPAKSHYFLGSDPARWQEDVPSYEQVRYDAVYPGIDLVFYGHEGELEYDFLMAPGADPRRVAMDLSGVTAMRVDREGNLVLTTGGGPIVWRKPVAYQVLDGERRAVESRYAVRGRRRVGFEVAAYDRTRPLVVDPVLSYSTFLGGGGSDAGHAVAVDVAGNAYVAGETASANFPGTGTLRGLVDAFVTKFDPSGTTRLYSVYLGGGGSDIAWGIAVDAGGNAYLTGETLSDNFPTTASAYQRVRSTGRDAFVTKLSAAGTLAYSTLLGGTSPDEGDRGNAVALDSAGNMVVTGRTDSVDFPVTAGAFFPFFRGEVFDAFVAKVNPSASGAASLVYSTFLGGSKNDAGFGIALDSADNPYVTGGTASPDFPALNAYQGSNTAGSTDAFLTKLNADATGLLYSTFLGGSGSNERASGIGLDASGNAVITGQTTSVDFPTKNALQAVMSGPGDAFVAKFDPSATGDASLLYSTYLGGSGVETGRAIAVDASGRVYVTGQTASSADFPIGNAVQPTYGGGPYDAFVTRLTADGTARLHSTYLGGNDTEGTAPTSQGGHGIAVSPCGDAWVTGRTVSPNFPTVGAAQPAPGGVGDAFLTRINDPDPPTILGVAPQWGPTAGGSGVTIVGTCFRPGATATFGGSAASGLTVVSAGAITATTPAHAAGPVDVVVTNPGLPPATGANAFTYGATGFFSLPPCRVLDTRNANGALGGPALAASADRTFTVRDVCGIPATAGAISVNVTVTQGSAAGDLRLRPGGTPLPLVSSINYAAGQTRANNATVPLGPGGTVAVRCVQGSGTVHFVLDVNGYYR
jgi:hypothetical protein